MPEFAAITCYFNPCGYRSRETAYRRFAEGLSRQGVSLWTIEATVPGQEFFVPPGERTLRVQLSTNDWIWQKECLLNRLIEQLPNEVKKVAWVDCDILFSNNDWALLAADSLDTWPVIQLFDFAFWLGPDDEVLQLRNGLDRRPSVASIAMHYPQRARDFRIGTPGLAWAARRDLLTAHGLYDRDIAGGGDAASVIGFYGWRDHWNLSCASDAMKVDAVAYINAVYPAVRGYVGYIPCSISHIWHGSLENRFYVARRQKLRELGYDPSRDVENDPANGMLRWTPHADPQLKEFLRTYFHERREDSPA